MLACVLFASFALPLKADAPNAAPLPPLNRDEISVQSWGDRNPNCVEWTNSCQVCRREADGKMNCSLPGIACQPRAMLCKATVKAQ